MASWIGRPGDWLKKTPEHEDNSSQAAESEDDDDDNPFIRLKFTKYTDYLEGFPSFAAWLASDPAFAIGRDYGDLRIKIRMYKQYKVEEAKEKLEELEKVAHSRGSNFLNSIGDLISEEGSKWEDALSKLDKSLQEFDEIQLRERQYRALPRPSSRNYKSLVNYLDRTRDIDNKEEDWFLRPNEMVSLTPAAEGTWLDDLLETLLKIIPGSQRIFTEKELRQANNEGMIVQYFTRDRVIILSKIATVLLAAMMVAAPVSALTKLTSQPELSLGIVVIFMTAVPLILIFCSKLGHNEIITFTAAYAAILVVFLSNSQNGLGICSCTGK